MQNNGIIYVVQGASLTANQTTVYTLFVKPHCFQKTSIRTHSEPD